MISGRATSEATQSYAGRFSGLPANYRAMAGLAVSSLGMGTYLGEYDPETDELYREAAKFAMGGGINVIDTAVNYRLQRSERVIGSAVAELVGERRVRREELIIASKGGYLTFDGELPPDPARYFEEKYIRTGLIKEGELVANSHCLAPAYLEAMLALSRANLGLETLDVYFLHNPETQLPVVGRAEFVHRLELAFAMLEGKVTDGQIAMYGAATWNGFRTGPQRPDYLSLTEMLEAATRVAGPKHHFKVIQLPVSLAMPEALTTANQALPGRREAVTILEAARQVGVAVWASASLLQGRLTASLPPVVGEAMTGLQTDAQRALQFVRSTPGVTVALVGMKSVEHVSENLEALRIAPASQQAYMRLFTKPAQS